MERSSYFNNQFVLSNDLNNTESTKASQSVYRTQAPLGDSGGVGGGITFWTGSVGRGGVFGSPADYLNPLLNMYPSASASSTIVISSGLALDQYGELIRLTAAKTLSLGGSDATYSWPASASVLNLVKIRYLEVQGSFKSDDLGVSFPTRVTPSFYINVSPLAPIAGEILLGTFFADGAGAIIGSIQDRRTYVRTITAANAVILDPTNKPVSAHVTAEDHVRAVGTGTPTTINPHGLSLADIGGISDATSKHRQDTHINGIVVKGYDINWQASYLGSIVNVAVDYISFNAPTANVQVALNGTIYTGSLPNLPANDPSAPSDGVYYVAVNSSFLPVFVSTASIPSFDINPEIYPQYLKLGRVVISSGGGVLTNFEDLRDWYGESVERIRADVDESTISPSGSVNRYDTLATSLSRIRHQLGLALNGTGSAWNGSHPVTAGPASNADAYHTHAANRFSSLRFAGLTYYGTGSVVRTLDTVYHNTLDYAIFVVASLALNGASPTDAVDADLEISDAVFAGAVDGSGHLVSGSVVWDTNLAANATNFFIGVACSGFVPVNAYYQIKTTLTAGGTVVLNSWVEQY